MDGGRGGVSSGCAAVVGAVWGEAGVSDLLRVFLRVCDSAGGMILHCLPSYRSGADEGVKVAPNFATLIVCRAIAGCFGGVLQVSCTL